MRARASARASSVPTGCWANVLATMLCHPVHVGLTFHRSIRQERRAADAASRSRAYAYGMAASVSSSVAGSMAPSSSSQASSRSCHSARPSTLRSPSRSKGTFGYPTSYASSGNWW